MLRAIAIWDRQAETTVRPAPFGPPKKAICMQQSSEKLPFLLSNIVRARDEGTKSEK